MKSLKHIALPSYPQSHSHRFGQPNLVAALDSIVNKEFGKKDNKRLPSYTQAFNALSDAGLEFVHFIYSQ
jgi:hypothetical protein